MANHEGSCDRGQRFLGSEISSQAHRAGIQVSGTCLMRESAAGTVTSSHRLDLRNHFEVTDLVEAVQPDVIINAAFRQRRWAPTAERGGPRRPAPAEELLPAPGSFTSPATPSSQGLRLRIDEDGPTLIRRPLTGRPRPQRRRQ